MGVSSNLIINAKWNVNHVKKLMEDGLGIKVTEERHKGDHSFLEFKFNGKDRTMYVAQSLDYGGLDATVLSLGSNKDSIDLFKKIAKVTGGFLQEEDTNENWESYQEPHNGNARFVLDHMILINAITDSRELSEKIQDATGYKNRV